MPSPLFLSTLQANRSEGETGLYWRYWTDPPSFRLKSFQWDNAVLLIKQNKNCEAVISPGIPGNPSFHVIPDIPGIPWSVLFCPAGSVNQRILKDVCLDSEGYNWEVRWAGQVGKSEGYVSREGEVGSPPHRGEEVIIGGRVGQVGGYIEWVGRVCWPCR